MRVDEAMVVAAQQHAAAWGVVCLQVCGHGAADAMLDVRALAAIGGHDLAAEAALFAAVPSHAPARVATAGLLVGGAAAAVHREFGAAGL